MELVVDRAEKPPLSSPDQGPASVAVDDAVVRDGEPAPGKAVRPEPATGGAGGEGRLAAVGPHLALLVVLVFVAWAFFSTDDRPPATRASGGVGAAAAPSPEPPAPLVEEPPPAVLQGTLRFGGKFYDVDRTGSGAVGIFQLADGGVAMWLERFSVTPGDGLELRLSEAAAPKTTADVLAAPFVPVGPLKAPAGAMHYPLAAGVDPARYKSVVVWSELTKSAYAAASLAEMPPPPGPPPPQAAGTPAPVQPRHIEDRAPQPGRAAVERTVERRLIPYEVVEERQVAPAPRPQEAPPRVERGTSPPPRPPARQPTTQPAAPSGDGGRQAGDGGRPSSDGGRPSGDGGRQSGDGAPQSGEGGRQPSPDDVIGNLDPLGNIKPPVADVPR